MIKVFVVRYVFKPFTTLVKRISNRPVTKTAMVRGVRVWESPTDRRTTVDCGRRVVLSTVIAFLADVILVVDASQAESLLIGGQRLSTTLRR